MESPPETPPKKAVDKKKPASGGAKFGSGTMLFLACIAAGFIGLFIFFVIYGAAS